MKKSAWLGYSLFLVCSYSTAALAQTPEGFGGLTPTDADRMGKQITAKDAATPETTS